MKKILFLMAFLFSGTVSASLDNSACATSVVNQIKTVTNLTGPGEAQAIEYWTVICKGFLDHIKSNADIVLDSGDIIIPATGLLDSTSSPVTGQAQNQGATLSGKIQ